MLLKAEYILLLTGLFCCSALQSSGAVLLQERSCPPNRIAAEFNSDHDETIVLGPCPEKFQSATNPYKQKRDVLSAKDEPRLSTALQLASTPAERTIRLPGTPYVYSPEELRRAGMRAYRAGNIGLAHEFLVPLANTGDAEAMFRVAVILTRRLIDQKEISGWPRLNKWLPLPEILSDDAPEDIVSGIAILHTLVSRDYIPAGAYLGFLYWRGTGVPKNSRTAFTLLTNAAENGDVDAYRVLAHINFGKGDYARYYKWSFLHVQCKGAERSPVKKGLRQNLLEIADIDIFDIYREAIPEPRIQYVTTGIEMLEAWKEQKGKFCVR